MQVEAVAWCRMSPGASDRKQRGSSPVQSPWMFRRRATRLAILVLAGAGLSACVGVHDGSYQQPYGTYSGDARFTAPYAYPRGSAPYLYNQSQSSWPRSYRHPNQGNDRNRYNRPGHDNRRNF
jgi:hypothetical protein